MEKEKGLLFSIFLQIFSSIYTIKYRIQTNAKKSSEKQLRHFDFYRAGTNFYFPSRTIFAVVILFYFYLECPYSY